MIPRIPGSIIDSTSIPQVSSGSPFVTTAPDHQKALSKFLGVRVSTHKNIYYLRPPNNRTNSAGLFGTGLLIELTMISIRYCLGPLLAEKGNRVSNRAHPLVPFAQGQTLLYNLISTKIS